MRSNLKYGPKTAKFAASLAWVDRLSEVGDPIRQRRDEAVAMMDRAEQWELTGLSLAMKACTDAHLLERRCAELWSADELLAAKQLSSEPNSKPASPAVAHPVR